MTLTTRVRGKGIPILLIHGVGSDSTVWDQVTPLLAPSVQTLAIDLRGHGKSAAVPNSTFSFAEFDEDLLRVFASSQLESAHLVGIGAGGFLALRMGLQQPERVRSLSLLGSSSHCDQHTKAVINRWAETYRDEGFDAYYLRLLKDLYYPDWIEAHLDLADELRDEVRKQNFPAVWAWASTVQTFDLRSQIHRIKLPTLAIQGLDDQVFDPSHGRLLRQSIFGTELKLFPETGHLTPIERPERTAEAIRTFVESVESKGTANPRAGTAADTASRPSSP